MPAGIVCYGEDENSELYAVSIAGTVYRVGAAAAVTANTAPLPSQASAALVSGTRIYPTIVYNNLITAELSGAYDVVHIFDMNGHEVLQQSIKGKKGTISIHLPNLRAGTYIVQLLGKTNHQQKIQIARQGN